MKYHISNVLAQCLASSIYPINVSFPYLIPPLFSVNVEQKTGNLPASGPSLAPAFINKALLKHSHVHLLIWCPRLLWPHNSRVDGFDRKRTVLEAENTIWPVTEFAALCFV